MAVGCVAGNVELPHIVRNTLAVLELAGRPDIPVAAGADRPLVRPLRTAADTHGPTGPGLRDAAGAATGGRARGRRRGHRRRPPAPAPAR